MNTTDFFRRWKKAGLWGYLALSCLTGVCAAPASGAYELKAAFIYRFAIYAEWPEQVFADNDNTLNFCVMGDNPFGPALDSIAGRYVQHRRLNIQFIHQGKAMGKCHILFISQSEQANLPVLLFQAHARHILTVSDMEQFSRQGGIIQLVMQEEKLRFTVNRVSAEQAGLTLSSNLLRLAMKIHGKDKP